MTRFKNEVEQFKGNYDSIITKSLAHGFRIPYESLASYTERIESLENLPESFFPSFFQEEIRKDYEVRTFFLNGNCYSMAIFSQNDSQTTVDFRRYNTKKGNRNVPFNHTNDEILKINSLMNSLNLQTGSIDFIMSIEGELYFLEVNPCGQYGMVSSPCNYNLDCEIAKYLCHG